MTARKPAMRAFFPAPAGVRVAVLRDIGTATIHTVVGWSVSANPADPMLPVVIGAAGCAEVFDVNDEAEIIATHGISPGEAFDVDEWTAHESAAAAANASALADRLLATVHAHGRAVVPVEGARLLDRAADELVASGQVAWSEDLEFVVSPEGVNS